MYQMVWPLWWYCLLDSSTPASPLAGHRGVRASWMVVTARMVILIIG